MSTFSPILLCEECCIISAGISEPTPEAEPQITSLVWKDIKEDEKDKDHKKINILGYNEKCYLELTSIGFDVGDEITLEIKENKENAETLKTLTVTIKEDNSAESEKEEETAIAAEDDWRGKQLIVYAKSDKADYFSGELLNIVCCQHALKLGDEADLIKELNIKLAGFGEQGNTVPSKKFDLLTENAVKQFQRDYMKVQQTGIVCKQFLENLDEFCEEYYIKIDSDTNFKVKCPCAGKINPCSGFGNNSTTGLKYTHTYPDHAKIKELKENIAKKKKEVDTEKDATLKSKLQAELTTFETELKDLPEKKKEQTYSGNEKPGIHRSLLWAVSAMKFYLDKVETSDNLTLGKFDSVYRCKSDNILHFDEKKEKPRTSNNHMGNAVDIHIYQNGIRKVSEKTKNKELSDKVRDFFAIYCGAFIRWPKQNRFSMENSQSTKTYNSKTKKYTNDEYIATTWVHIDCREFRTVLNYQENKLYCKNEAELKGNTLMSLLQTSDNGICADIDNCTYLAEVLSDRVRQDSLWLGVIKLDKDDHNSIIYSEEDSKWLPSQTKNATTRIQSVVIILEENDSEYKIKSIAEKEKDIKEGWVNKEYIREIFKFIKN